MTTTKGETMSPTTRTRRLAAALGVGAALLMPLAACGSGTPAAPTTVTVGPGGIVTKAPGQCETDTLHVPVDCADPSAKNPQAKFSLEAKQRADAAQHGGGFPWWGWVLAGLGVLIVVPFAIATAITAATGSTTLTGEDFDEIEAEVRTELRAEGHTFDTDAEFDDDYDDYEAVQQPQPPSPPPAPQAAPAPQAVPTEPGGSSFLEELSRRLDSQGGA